MKTLSISIITLVIFLFGTKIKVVDATSQQWAGGRYESGYGTDYKITLVAKKKSEVLTIDELWVGDDFFEVKPVKDLANRSDHTFSRKDTVYIIAGVKFKPDGHGKDVKEKGLIKQAPRGFNGEALLGYSYRGKRRYIEIEKFRILEKIIYP